MRAEKFTDYELYAHYRNSLRDLLDADAVIREMGTDGVDPEHLRVVWDAMALESHRANEEAERDR